MKRAYRILEQNEYFYPQVCETLFGFRLGKWMKINYGGIEHGYSLYSHLSNGDLDINEAMNVIRGYKRWLKVGLPSVKIHDVSE